MDDAFIRLERDLESAIVWLRQLNLRAQESRFGSCLRRLQEFNRIRRSPQIDPDDYTRGLHGFLYVAHDVYELVAIHQNLSRIADEVFVRRAAKMLKGPEREVEEKGAGIIGRSIGFELMVASILAAGGVRPDLSGPGDLSVVVDGVRVDIECKRPQSRDNLQHAIADGADQLARRSGTVAGQEDLGVLALSIGKVIHAGDKVLSVKSRSEGLRRLRDGTQGFVDEHEGAWRRGVGAAVDVVIIYLSAMCEIAPQRALMWTQTLGYFPVDVAAPARIAPILDVLSKSMAN